jgi:hypothetical protein
MGKLATEPGPPDDMVLRREQPLTSIRTWDPEVYVAYEHWLSRRHDGLLPARKDIDVPQLKPILGHIHLVDVSAPDPADYRFRLYGSMVRLDRSRNYTNLRIGDYPSKPYRTALMEDYSRVVSTGAPLYQHVVARLKSISYSYGRLILPLADDGSKVTMLVVCTHDRAGDKSMRP